MNRKFLINIHLYLSAFFLPFLLLMPLTGFLYLLGEKGEATRELVYSINETMPVEVEEQKAWIQENLDRFDSTYTYESIRSGNKTHILRPSHKPYYNLIETDEGVDFYKVSPNFLQSMVELHKGHGPQVVRKLQTVFGLGLLIVVISGVCLALTVAPYRKKTFIGLALGLIVFFGTFWL